MAEPSGRKLDELYRLAWRNGCKTTYYLRSQRRDARGEEHAAGHGRQAQRGHPGGGLRCPALRRPAAPRPAACTAAVRRRTGSGPHRRRLPRSARWTTPTAKPASSRPLFRSRPRERARPRPPHRRKESMTTVNTTGLGEIQSGSRPRRRRRQADDQLSRRRQPAAAAQVPLGVGEVPGRLQQPLDADRGQHAGRHRAVEVARTGSPRTSG